MKSQAKGTLLVPSVFLVVLFAASVAAQAPPAFLPPPLNPSGVQLVPRELVPGVYALIASRPPVDNSGFVVGERGVLVIDAHINGAMARQIQAAVRQATNKPIMYVVNTNCFGDHWFGNYAFPQETAIVASQATIGCMKNFENMKRDLLPTVDNDPSVLADVQPRLPDVAFDHNLRLDLGGRTVELYHFGAGNTPGDTVVYLPAEKLAWTGNLILGDGTIPILFRGGAEPYLETVSRLASTLDVATIIPGHGLPTTGAIFGRYLRYLSDLLESVRKATREGLSLEQVIASTPLAPEFAPSQTLDGPLAQFARRFIPGVHTLNVTRTYEDFKKR
jgi:cyclase